MIKPKKIRKGDGQYFIGSAGYWVDPNHTEAQERLAAAVALGDEDLIVDAASEYAAAEQAAAVKSTKREATKRAKAASTKRRKASSAKGGKAKAGKPAYFTSAILSMVGLQFESARSYHARRDKAGLVWPELIDVASDGRLDGYQDAIELGLRELSYDEHVDELVFTFRRKGSEITKRYTQSKLSDLIRTNEHLIQFSN